MDQQMESQSPVMHTCIYIDFEGPSKDVETLKNILLTLIKSKHTRSYFLYKNTDEKTFIKWSRKRFSVKRKNSQNQY
jgi:hypothetical protein